MVRLSSFDKAVLMLFDVIKSRSEEDMSDLIGTHGISRQSFKKLEKLKIVDSDSWETEGYPSSSYVKFTEQTGVETFDIDTCADYYEQIAFNMIKLKALVDKIKRKIR